jgi:hypothetical protein
MLRLLFDQAYAMRPSIIFFDEIDGLAPVRTSRQEQNYSSIVSTLLALMDGLDARGDVVVIGATVGASRTAVQHSWSVLALSTLSQHLGNITCFETNPAASLLSNTALRALITAACCRIGLTTLTQPCGVPDVLTANSAFRCRRESPDSRS